jgi:hypothetical protein
LELNDGQVRADETIPEDAFNGFFKMWMDCEFNSKESIAESTSKLSDEWKKLVGRDAIAVSSTGTSQDNKSADKLPEKRAATNIQSLIKKKPKA